MPLERVLPPKKRASYRLTIESQEQQAGEADKAKGVVVTVKTSWSALQIEPLQASNEAAINVMVDAADPKPIDLTTKFNGDAELKKQASKRRALPVQLTLPVSPEPETIKPAAAAVVASLPAPPAPVVEAPAPAPAPAREPEPEPVAGPSGLCNPNKVNDENDKPAKRATRQRATKSPRNHECDVCFKSFVQKSSLTTHKRIHTGEKPLKCDFCPRRFGDASTHKKHMRTHTKEQPYGCRICPKIFSQSGNCLRHERGLHPKEYALLPKKTKSKRGGAGKK